MTSLGVASVTLLDTTAPVGADPAVQMGSGRMIPHDATNYQRRRYEASCGEFMCWVLPLLLLHKLTVDLPR